MRVRGGFSIAECAVVSSPEDYTETLLELHDAEVKKMKSHYETHKDLFVAVQKWEENWKLFLELEVLSVQEGALPGPVVGHWAAHASAPTCRALLGKTREALGNTVGRRGAVSGALVWFVMGGCAAGMASSRGRVLRGVGWAAGPGGVFGSLLTSLRP